MKTPDQPITQNSSDSSDGAFLDSLYRISSLVSRTEDPDEALALILEEIIRVLGASSASIAMINPDTKTLQIDVQRGLPSSHIGLELPLGVGLTGWVALHGRALNVPDVTEDERYIAAREATRSEMAVPMIEQGETIGVVNIDSDQVNAFSENDLKVLSLLTSEAARVVSRIWLIRQLKLKADQLQTLLSLAQNIGSKLETSEVINLVTRETRKLLQVPFCALFLETEQTKRLKLEHLRGPNGPHQIDEEIAIGESVLGTALERRKVVEVVNLAQTEEHLLTQLIQEEGLKSMLCAPIVIEGKAIGILAGITKQTRRFNNDEKRAFTLLAGLGAVAIHNAQLYSRLFTGEESLRKNERLTTLGLLAAEIAHEIRNPLTVIELLFESLDLNFPEADPRAKDASIIREKLSQLELIVNRVLDFGKTRRDMRAQYPIDVLIEETLTLVRLKLAQSRIKLAGEWQPDEDLSVSVNKGQMQQVLLNLIINATESIGTDGRIEISASLEQREDQEVVTVRVKDTGGGVRPEIREQIFESFLSGRNEGSGLGLSIVKRIMKAHRGDIVLETSGPEGSCFCFWLPRGRAD